MRILSENNVMGMVAYQEASEIPAFVVMDWVDGPNLKEAVVSRQLEEWSLLVRIAVDLTDVIRRAHLLPERVLHRDLRPANIMLEYFYSDPDNWRVVVLDFDLSWHRGATERSIIHTSSSLGYLAPEQITTSGKVSTRHSAVDSFGLGMTFYYMISGQDPLPSQQRHRDWGDLLRGASQRRPCHEWASTPRRFARLIQNATRDKQNERWDVSQIQGELERLLAAILSPETVRSAEMLAEEVAMRTEVMRNYEWDPDRRAARIRLPSGLSIEVIGDESAARVRIEVKWQSTGVDEWKKVGKWIAPAAKNAASALLGGKWRIDAEESGASKVRIAASIDANVRQQSVESLAISIDAAANALRLQ
jgi:serine/threonine protein kinase